MAADTHHGGVTVAKLQVAVEVFHPDFSGIFFRDPLPGYQAAPHRGFSVVEF